MVQDGSPALLHCSHLDRREMKGKEAPFLWRAWTGSWTSPFLLISCHNLVRLVTYSCCSKLPKCSGLKQEKCILSQFFLGLSELKSGCPHGYTPPGGFWENFLASSSFWWLAVFLAWDCVTPISTYVVIRPSSLPYVIPLDLYFIRTFVIAFGNHPIVQNNLSISRSLTQPSWQEVCYHIGNFQTIQGLRLGYLRRP